jgi:hypothetical protein
MCDFCAHMIYFHEVLNFWMRREGVGGRGRGEGVGVGGGGGGKGGGEI